MIPTYALQLLRGFSGSGSKDSGSNPRKSDMSALGRWLRDLRPGNRPEPPELAPQRHHPAYHSERRRRHKPTPGHDHRRHSFNDHPRQRCYSHGCEVRQMASGAPTPPTRDASSLRAPPTGHEKFPSWPVAAGADTPPPLRAPPTGGSTRSKSFTDHTEYPKEQPLTYTRPYMKRQHHTAAAYSKQLKTVMERCEKLGAEVFESRRYPPPPHPLALLPCVDREGVALGDLDYAVPSPPERDAPPLCQADLEAYLRHTQPYAHSEGYHSYVSSTDSASTTPFLDRLRRDAEVKAVHGGRDSVVTTSSGSASSSETLKWHGSLSDVSSHSGAQHHQLIAHSARVQTPQRHHSESVLYMDPQHQQRKLFPVTTYSVPPPSVQDRVNELERHQRYTYLDPDKKHRVSDPTLKAIQKKALLSFYERHHGSWRSEPQLAVPQAPQPPPRPLPQSPSRRASCASDYAGSLRRGPVIVGPAISVDDWVPERPPKNPALRSYRAPSPPELPPPSPPPTPDVEAYNSDEPLPPPPEDLVPPAPPARPWHRQSFMHTKPLPPVPHVEPPPLHPRQNRVNQSMRARISTSHSTTTTTTRKSHTSNHMSASKASYLAARREREAALCGGDAGSYKRTMSPGGETRELCPRLQPTPITTTPLISKTNVVRRPSISEKAPPLPDVLPRDSPPLARFQTPPVSPCPSPQPLQLIQRTEVTLRVNASTSDAGCQTEGEEAPPVRKKLQEEIECERLQQDLVEQLGSSDRLKSILVPGPEHRKPTDYISASGLFKVEVTSRIRTNSNTPPSSPTCLTSSISPQPSELSSSSAYFTTSEPKAKFLTSLASNTNLNCLSRDSGELERKKEELVSRLARKLEVLRAEARAVSEERKVNEELGASVARRVSRSARPPETAKFRLHVDEVGQITALLLGLSGRLARAENALMSLDEINTERKSLEDKRDKLATQLTEAKQLKESIDKRSGHVSNMLVQYLSADEYADYDHFINMKAKLIMDARDISDKIKLGEEQLQALKDTLADV